MREQHRCSSGHSSCSGSGSGGGGSGSGCGGGSGCDIVSSKALLHLWMVGQVDSKPCRLMQLELVTKSRGCEHRLPQQLSSVQCS